MSTVYKRAQEALLRIQDEINLLEREMYELRIFLRVHEKLTEPGISMSDTSSIVVCRDSDVAEGNGPSAELEDSVPSSVESKPEDPTQTEEMASFAIHEFGPMRARNLFEIMVGYGYHPAGKNPVEVLRNRLYRSPLFQNERGVFSLRQGA